MPAKRDAYALAHKGLRNILFTCSTRIGAADFADADQRGAVFELLEWTLGFFGLHQAMEEDDYHPILETVQTGLCDRAHTDHADEEALHRSIRDAMSAIDGASAEDVIDAGWHLYHVFNVWLAQYVLHIDHEDRVLESRFFEVVDDAKMAGLRAKVMAKLSPEDMKRWMGFFLPAMSDRENAALLGGIKRNAPPPVYEGMAAGAAMVLGDRWAAVAAAIDAA